MSTAGIIFSDSYDVDKNELTRARTLAAIPFGGRYRMIDFTLSNMASAGIATVGIVTMRNYIDLMKHIRGGAVWDLDKKRSALTFLPPHGADNVKGLYNSRLDALQTHRKFIEKLDEDYLFIVSCNYVGNLDYEKIMDFHMETGAKITAVYTRHPMFKRDGMHVSKYTIGLGNRLEHVEISHHLDEGDAFGINCFVMKRTDLLEMIYSTAEEGKTDFSMNILEPLAKAGEAAAFETDAKLLFMDDSSMYLRSSLALLDREVRQELFEQENHPVITRARDSAPGSYGENAVVENCLIADGVRIEGTVRNSIIFRDVIVKEGAVVENSVIMQDAIVGQNAHLSYAILDNNVVINDDRVLAGYITHPFYLDEGTVI